MTYTVEDILEILAGIVPRAVNIRLDRSEKNLLQSLGRQVHKGLALTDRQLDLALTKIGKYRDGLVANSVDVDNILVSKPLRLPLREVDRSQRIFFGDDPVTGNQRICIRFVFSKKTDEIWNSLRNSLDGEISFDKNIKFIPATELNLYRIVETLKPNGFDVDPDIEEIYEKIDEILKNPQKFQPHVDLENEKFVLKNVTKAVSEIIDKQFSEVDENNFVDYLISLKRLEIFHKNPKISEKIKNLEFDDLTKAVLDTPFNKILLNSEKYKIDQVLQVVKNLNQWPLLIVLEEKPGLFNEVKILHDILKDMLPHDAMTVFFRLSKGQQNAEEFNQFVKDNHLNNYIDEKTKVVFITKERIPKPLLKSSWCPHTALVLSRFDYGRIGAYVSGFRTVYYYNNSIVVQTITNRSKSLVEL